MLRKKEDGRIVKENSLRAVAVMHVPINDRHALDFLIFILRVTRRDRDVIEQDKIPSRVRPSRDVRADEPRTKALSASPFITASTARHAPPAA